MADMRDISDLNKPRSDQINASTLARPITARIRAVRETGSREQPMAIVLDGGHQPFKPCLTMRRLLGRLWGLDATAWVGRWLTLYCDPSVTMGKHRTGGVRISHASHISGPVTVTLAVSRGRWADYTVQPLRDPRQEGAPTADLDAVMRDAGLTPAQLDSHRASLDRGPISDLSVEQRAAYAVWLARPDNLEKVRSYLASATGEE